MRRILIPTLTISLIATTAAISAAQTITVFDDSGARAGLKVGYGGHGIDWETSSDSRSFADFVRVRGFLGHGQWVDWDSANAGRVTRAGAAVILMRPRLGPVDVRGYVGLGIAAYLPQRVDSRTHSAARFILGMEGRAASLSFSQSPRQTRPRVVIGRVHRLVGHAWTAARA
jgi:hypothetical protein